MGEFMSVKFNLPARILSDKRINHTAVIVYGILCDAAYPHADGTHVWTDVSNSAILELFGDNMSSRTLNRTITLLEDCGYIKRTMLVRVGQQNVRVIEILGDNQ